VTTELVSTTGEHHVYQKTVPSILRGGDPCRPSCQQLRKLVQALCATGWASLDQDVNECLVFHTELQFCCWSKKMKMKLFRSLLVMIYVFSGSQYVDADGNKIDPVLLRDHKMSVINRITDLQDFSGTRATVIHLQLRRYGLEIDNQFDSVTDILLEDGNIEQYVYKFTNTPKKVILHTTHTHK
jgi:hypothetical protein